MAHKHSTRIVPATSGSVTTAARPFTNLRRSVDRLIEDFDRDFWRAPFRNFLDLGGITVPAAEVSETDGEYAVTLELPGMAETDVDVSVDGNILTISGEKKEEREETRKDYTMSERRYGSFSRSFELPAGVNEDAISASFAKGVLTVTVPKPAGIPSTTKKIDIRVG